MMVIHYEVFDDGPNYADLLVDSLRTQEERLQPTPDLVVADAAFYTSANEKALEAAGVKRISVPNRGAKSKARRQTLVQERTAMARGIGRTD